jgi:hypothetical protein
MMKTGMAKIVEISVMLVLWCMPMEAFFETLMGKELGKKLPTEHTLFSLLSYPKLPIYDPQAIFSQKVSSTIVNGQNVVKKHIRSIDPRIDIQNHFATISSSFLYFKKPKTTAYSIAPQELRALGDVFTKQEQYDLFSDQNKWLNGNIADMSNRYAHSTKEVLKEGTRCCIVGDLHGDLYALEKVIEDAKRRALLDDHWKIADNVEFVFLGDYVDRGLYSSEVVWFLMRLKVANPDKVILIRGNHEFIELREWGTEAELLLKYGSNEAHTLCQELYLWFNYFLAAHFITCNEYMIEFCHGGVDPLYDFVPFLKSGAQAVFIKPLVMMQEGQLDSWEQRLRQELSERMRQADIYKAHEAVAFLNREQLDDYNQCRGFYWTDFYGSMNSELMLNQGENTRGVGFIATDAWVAQDYLKKMSQELAPITFTTIIRGHQHSPSGIKLLKNNGKCAEPQRWRECIAPEKIKNGNTISLLDAGPIITLSNYIGADEHLKVPSIINYGLLTLGKRAEQCEFECVELT